MLKARTNHASTALNGEVYAVGGEGPLRTPSHPLRPRQWPQGPLLAS